MLWSRRGKGCGHEVDPDMTCPTGKIALTYKVAVKAARQSRNHYTRAMTAYKCTECGQWHTGAPNGPKRKGPLKIINRNH